MEAVRARAPVRIDLAGGTLDIWPLYLALGGVVTVNAALDLPVEALVQPRPGGAITLRSEDLGRAPRGRAACRAWPRRWAPCGPRAGSR